ncbi:MAG: hypothetical protein AAF211_15225, partial [Myxococcota bacterium]
DAPVDRQGRFRYAHARDQPVELRPPETPTLQLTVDGTSVAIDVVDPFGRLTADRFFGSLRRGLTPDQNLVELDRSHGGAGLGLARSLREGTLLRAEVTPGVRTLVAWWRDRDRPPTEGARSAIFLETAP